MERFLQDFLTKTQIFSPYMQLEGENIHFFSIQKLKIA